jgi:hypothetical protein
MKTRRQVAEFIEFQFSDEYLTPLEKGNQHHYGKQELRALLDYIFDGPPETRNDELLPKDIVIKGRVA